MQNIFKLKLNKIILKNFYHIIQLERFPEWFPSDQ